MVHSRFLDQHLPVVGKSAPVPLHLPQRRDQHPARQRELGCTPASRSSKLQAVRGDELTKALPAIDTEGSDSANLRQTPSSCSTFGPQPRARPDDDGAGALGKPPRVDGAREEGLLRVSTPGLMEPWDGPASIAFTDGIRVGATLDPQRPAAGRYYVTADGRVRHGVRSGVLDIRARSGRGQGPPSAGPHVPGRHGRAAHRLRRRAQAPRRHGAIPTRSGCMSGWSS